MFWLGSAVRFWRPVSSLRCSLPSLSSSWWRFNPVLDSSPCFFLGGKSFFGSLPLPPPLWQLEPTGSLGSPPPPVLQRRVSFASFDLVEAASYCSCALFRSIFE